MDAYSYIRFSSLEQADGDSYRRQQKAIDDFVKENNLTLKDSEAFKDLGVSGFRGSNLKQGLGRFIAEVEAGKIRPGSYLIVESLDRLSRQNMVDSLSLLISLIGRGIRVVALNDNGIKVLDKDADFPAFVITLGTMFRAHDESAKKSMRLKAVWTHKKRNAKAAPVTSRCPEWLTFDKQRNAFKPIPERVKTIKKIFELADKGIGRHRIVKLLNQQEVKSFRNESNGWQNSSIGKLLKNRALIGYYQPASVTYDQETGKERRVPDGDEVADYYPRVIDLDLFNRVASRRYTDAAPLVGRQGDSLSNLFTGMAFCGWCEAPMTMCNKGPQPKGGRYLVCSKAMRGKGCIYRSWPYGHLEPFILSKMREIDFGQVLDSTSIEQELQSIRNQKADLHARLIASKETQANLQESVDTFKGKLPGGLLDKWNKEEEACVAFGQELEELDAKEIDLASRQSDPEEFGTQLLKLYDAMDQSDERSRYLIRVRLRNRLGLAIERIVVRALSTNEQRVAKDTGTPKHRTVVLQFRNGTARTIAAIGKTGTFVLDLKQSPETL